MSKTISLASLFVLLIGTVYCTAAEPKKTRKYEELGIIPWRLDQEAARAEAKKTGKPLMVLYTELPGCGGCKVFGRRQLSHPLVVDGSACFVPLAVKFVGWPTTHFRDAEGKDLIPKVGHSREVGPLLTGMVQALEANKHEAPPYLKLAAMETAKTETAVFGMGCFWSGEVKLGGVDGVVATRAGFLRGEVVEVKFDPAVVSYRELLQQARKLSCASFVVARTDEQAKTAREVVGGNSAKRVIRSDDPMRFSEKDTKYRLRHRPRYFLLPLTEMQATKVNAALGGAGSKPDTYLSPTQRDLLAELNGLSDAEVKRLELKPVRSNAGIAQYAATLKRKLDESPPKRKG